MYILQLLTLFQPLSTTLILTHLLVSRQSPHESPGLTEAQICNNMAKFLPTSLSLAIKARVFYVFKVCLKGGLKIQTNIVRCAWQRQKFSFVRSNPQNKKQKLLLALCLDFSARNDQSSYLIMGKTASKTIFQKLFLHWQLQANIQVSRFEYEAEVVPATMMCCVQFINHLLDQSRVKPLQST